MSDSTAHLKMIQMKSTSTSHQHSHSRCMIVFCINILTPCFFRAGHVTCSGHTTLDGGALRHAPLRLLDLESVCSGRSDQSDWLYQVRPRYQDIGPSKHPMFSLISSRKKKKSRKPYKNQGGRISAKLLTRWPMKDVFINFMHIHRSGIFTVLYMILLFEAFSFFYIRTR